MKIPVEIAVGCEIIYLKDEYRYQSGTVTNICGGSITIEGPVVVHIEKIIQFTFGGVWMINHKCELNYYGRFLP